jgi:1,2-diacylglycerol 3-beta-glucosyltransferase
MWVVASGLTIVFLFYTLGMFVASRRRRPVLPERPDDLFFVFVIPCLNEELVIGTSIDRLVALPGRNFAVLVVDDGSTDGTADVVRSRAGDRVWLFQRRPPYARQGKGAALNHAVSYLRSSGLLAGRSSGDVVVAIVDADGRVEPDVLYEVAPYFADPRVGAVQIGVRMYNAGHGVLARMQDFEFVTFTEVFQRARHRLGSAGLGGNGQFNRLSALEALGEDPWSDCLTEDLDLGIRLLAGGWGNAFCPTTWVNQQAVTDVRRLVRQRGRWFQGHLQCWRRLTTVMDSGLPPRTTLDLLHILLSPALVLFMSLSVVLFVGTTSVLVVTAPHQLLTALVAHHGLLLVVAYALSFGLAVPYGFVYWLQTPSASFPRALWWGHVFTLYNYLWFVAGWLAVFRMVRRRQGWQKTERTAVEAVLPATS